ncbi:hypothetical protein ILYODFUR_025763 [Ilyodon furcidens]|uniref:Uncharacterized protein n=1 Tax=Ilyodon furcidens TaxID=33524 RepID=A0ABV0U0L6_9TELE
MGIEVPHQNDGVPERASTPNRDTKKATYCTPLLCPTVRDLSLTRRRRDATFSSTKVNLNTRQLSWGGGDKQTHNILPPLPMRNSRVQAQSPSSGWWCAQQFLANISQPLTQA